MVGERGSISPSHLVVGVVAVALLVAFVLRQRRIRDPPWGSSSSVRR
ncbi:hypothetical protein [Saccharopolyspora sp. NPDC002376]